MNQDKLRTKNTLSGNCCTREQLTCKGYKRKDGLYDIEAHLIDSKSYDFSNRDRGGTIHAGEPLHEMHVRITLDLEMSVVEAQAVTKWGPYTICPDGATSFKRLVGLKIGPGWRRQVNQLLGGTKGCTHIRELLGPIATTAFQTMAAEMPSMKKNADQSPPALMNSCYAYADNGPVIAREWPRWHKKSRGGLRPEAAITVFPGTILRCSCCAAKSSLEVVFYRRQVSGLDFTIFHQMFFCRSGDQLIECLSD